jgi:hypothetical protein
VNFVLSRIYHDANFESLAGAPPRINASDKTPTITLRITPCANDRAPTVRKVCYSRDKFDKFINSEGSTAKLEAKRIGSASKSNARRLFHLMGSVEKLVIQRLIWRWPPNSTHAPRPFSSAF